MTIGNKTQITNFIDSLNVTKQGQLYNMIKQHIEENPSKTLDDFFADEPAAVRIHSSQKTCIACEG